MSMPYVVPAAVAARLTKVEEENRRLKRLAAAAAFLSLVSAIVVAGTLIRPGLAQEGASRPETIRASDYAMYDSAGRVRVHLFFSDTKGSPMLTFNDADGRGRLIISADDEATSIMAYSPNGGQFLAESVASLDGAIVQSSRMQKGAPKGTASLFAFKDFTSMTVEDADGFRTIVGNASLPGPTPQKPERTSAASVVMYGKGGHVVWQSPPQRPQR